MSKQELEKEFNLLDEPWIIVRTAENETKTWSILETFAHAHEAKALEGELPTQDIAIMRLLLAIMHGAFVNDDIEDCEDAIGLWQELWEKKKFPYEIIQEYLEPYRERFWLFHPTQPFYQSAHIQENMNAYKVAKGKKTKDEVKWKTVARYAADLFQSDNKPSLFPIRTGEAQKELDYGEAARWLLHLNGFDDNSAKNPVPKLGYLAQLGLIFAKGNNLFETLMFNFVLSMDGKHIFDDHKMNNSAYWEKPVCEIIEREIPQPGAQKDLLTLQSRRILLHRENKKVTGYLLTMGDFFSENSSWENETMTMWEKNKEGHFMPKRHEKPRQIWRDFSSLMGSSGYSGPLESKELAPGVISWLRLITQKMLHSIKINIAITGTYYEKNASAWIIKDYVYDDVSVNASLLKKLNQGWIYEIIRNLRLVDNAVSALGNLSRDIVIAAENGLDDEKNGQDKFLNEEYQNSCEDAYHHLDQTFRRWLSSINPDKDCIEDKMEEWLSSAKKVLISLGNELIEQCPESAIVGRKKNAIEAYLNFRSRIKKALE